MGYRSDGILAVDNKVLLAMKLAGNLPKLLEDMTRTYSDDVNKSEGYSVFQYEDWKMYDSYPDVDEFNIFLDRLTAFQEELEADKDKDWAETKVFAYMRIGEDDDDVQSLGDPYYFDIYYHRSISWG